MRITRVLDGFLNGSGGWDGGLSAGRRSWNRRCYGEMEVEAWGYSEWISGVFFAFCIRECVTKVLTNSGILGGIWVKWTYA